MNDRKIAGGAHQAASVLPPVVAVVQPGPQLVSGASGEFIEVGIERHRNLNNLDILVIPAIHSLLVARLNHLLRRIIRIACCRTAHKTSSLTQRVSLDITDSGEIFGEASRKTCDRYRSERQA